MACKKKSSDKLPHPPDNFTLCAKNKRIFLFTVFSETCKPNEKKNGDRKNKS